MEEASYVAGPSSVVSNGKGGIEERLVREGTQKGYRVEKIRFSDAIRAGNTCERPELDIHVN
jgi:hypothetical protein